MCQWIPEKKEESLSRIIQGRVNLCNFVRVRDNFSLSPQKISSKQPIANKPEFILNDGKGECHFNQILVSESETQEGKNKLRIFIKS